MNNMIPLGACVRRPASPTPRNFHGNRCQQHLFHTSHDDFDDSPLRRCTPSLVAQMALSGGQVLLVAWLLQRVHAQWPQLCPNQSGGPWSTYNETRCAAGTTCCVVGFSLSTQGCCTFANATCCDNGYSCCPSGTQCNLVAGSGYGGSCVVPPHMPPPRCRLVAADAVRRLSYSAGDHACLLPPSSQRCTTVLTPQPCST